MKKVINFFKRLFSPKYIDIQKTEQLKENGITAVF